MNRNGGGRRGNLHEVLKRALIVRCLAPFFILSCSSDDDPEAFNHGNAFQVDQQAGDGHSPPDPSQRHVPRRHLRERIDRGPFVDQVKIPDPFRTPPDDLRLPRSFVFLPFVGVGCPFSLNGPCRPWFHLFARLATIRPCFWSAAKIYVISRPSIDNVRRTLNLPEAAVRDKKGHAMSSVVRVAVCTWLCLSSCLEGEVNKRIDSSTGWSVYSLQQGSTEVELVPEAGCNVFSIQVDRVEYLRVPEQIENLPGVGYGTPILYPTPNRVRNAVFRFQDQEFRFPPNNGDNFIHGLVHSVPWQVTDTGSSAERSWLQAETHFTSDHATFPLPHRLRVTVVVMEGRVRWEYEVDNRAGSATVPFGFGLHPYFPYQGARAETYLHVPATHWMESEALVPTGRLIELEGTPYDLRTPTSLADRMLDDVFFGITPEHPARVEFRDVGRQIVFQASPEFTHMVVYTPDRPFFCVENQTCSTDAHNLANAGKNDVAHLLTCPVGETRTGWVEYRFGAGKTR